MRVKGKAGMPHRRPRFREPTVKTRCCRVKQRVGAEDRYGKKENLGDFGSILVLLCIGAGLPVIAPASVKLVKK